MSESASTIRRAYRMRAYPDRAQRAMLARLGGATRYVWNWALDLRSRAYSTDGTRLNWITLSRRFTQLRAEPGTAWLAALPREPFNQVLRDQEHAFSNFFAKRAKYPRFRRRGSPVSMRFTLDQRRAQVERGDGRWAYVSLPGLGRLKLRRTEALAGRLRSVTLRREADQWYAAITADGVEATVAGAPVYNFIGVDAGLKDLVVLSNGTRVAAPSTLRRRLDRLRRYQRHYVRQRDAAAKRQGLDPSRPFPKGTRLEPSRRMGKTKRTVARAHQRIAALRREALHRATTGLVRCAAVIAIEDLDVRAMNRSMGRHAFRRSAANAALGELRRQIEYKAAWSGRVVHIVDRWYPSSKTCAHCGHVHRWLKLNERRWTCSACGTSHDRDFNAARNLAAHAARALATVPSPADANATRMSRESNARGELCVADQAQVIVLAQRRRSQNREPSARRGAPKASRGTSGTCREKPA